MRRTAIVAVSQLVSTSDKDFNPYRNRLELRPAVLAVRGIVIVPLGGARRASLRADFAGSLGGQFHRNNSSWNGDDGVTEKHQRGS